MKRICFIAYAEYYKDARIKTYINTLLNSGYEVDLFCLYDEHSEKFSLKITNFNIYFISKKYRGDNKLFYLFSYLFFFSKCFFSVTIKYFQKKYSIFHINNQPDFLVFIPIIAKIFGSKIILDLHDIMIAVVISKFESSERSLTYRVTKFQTKISVKFCDTLIFADHSQQEFLANKGIEHKNSYVYLNLPDENFFKVRKDSYNINGTTQLVFHGTIAERLGLDLVIKAVQIASKEVNLTFTIIGGGDYKDKLENYCKQNNILNRLVFFKSYIPVEHLQEEIEKYDIGIIGNRRSILAEKCMLPVKLIEYLYIGLPVIAPRLEVIQRYFSEDMIEYYQPNDINDMSEKIINLCQNERKRNALIINSKSFFNSYNSPGQKKVYINLIESLLNR